MSKNKNRNRVIQLPGGALEQLRQEQLMKIQAHLEELGKQNEMRFSDFNMVLRECLRNMMGGTESPADIIKDVESIASAITAHKMKLHYEGVRDVIRDLNVQDLPDHVTWAARRAGVELEPDEEPEAAESSESPLLGADGKTLSPTPALEPKAS